MEDGSDEQDVLSECGLGVFCKAFLEFGRWMVGWSTDASCWMERFDAGCLVLLGGCCRWYVLGGADVCCENCPWMVVPDGFVAGIGSGVDGAYVGDRGAVGRR